MNWLFPSVILILIWMTVGEQYTDRYDNMDIEEILSNKRLLVAYIKCILEKGQCTAEGKELKLHIKDGMQSSCSKCTDFQKKNARKVVKHIRENENTYWEELKNKYDPENKYKQIYERFLVADD